MASLTRLQVNPAVLEWARTTAGLDPETAARRVGVKASRVAEWEGGDVLPTIKQLRSLAAVYQRPLAALLLPAPLEDEKRPSLPDFRRAEKRAGVNSTFLLKAIVRAQRQQEALREIADELDWPESETYAELALSDAMDVGKAGSALRAALQVDLLPRSVQRRPDDFLRELVRRAEELGVTVIQVQRVPTADMRGFSLGEGPFPVVALNGGDWPRGKVYTLLHELAHVGLRSSGLCDFQHADDPDLERRCEAIAASALMPAPVFLDRLGATRGNSLSVDAARAIGADFGASGEAAVLRMIELGRATWEDYWRLKPDFEEAYAQYKREEKAKSEGKDSPIYYQLKARDLGRRFIRQVLEAYGEDAISTRDVVHLLEVPYDKLGKLAGTLGDVAV
ncbi:MAG: XRE family transcriptional regulator [Actinomycetales bacterium]|nr:XRE family transcriptional regulator [Actinomycetales bacterium]